MSFEEADKEKGMMGLARGDEIEGHEQLGMKT
jgi:hypothetical protein